MKPFYDAGLKDLAIGTGNPPHSIQSCTSFKRTGSLWKHGRVCTGTCSKVSLRNMGLSFSSSAVTHSSRTSGLRRGHESHKMHATLALTGNGRTKCSVWLPQVATFMKSLLKMTPGNFGHNLCLKIAYHTLACLWWKLASENGITQVHGSRLCSIWSPNLPKADFTAHSRCISHATRVVGVLWEREDLHWAFQGTISTQWGSMNATKCW